MSLLNPLKLLPMYFYFGFTSKGMKIVLHFIKFATFRNNFHTHKHTHTCKTSWRYEIFTLRTQI